MRKSISLLSHSSNVNKTISERTKNKTSQNLKLKQRKLTKKIAKNHSPFWITGISQLSGGIVLILAALIMGADLLTFDWYSLGVFSYICTASTIAYVLWNYILKTSDLSNMFIIKFSEPLFACLFGALLLKEDILKWQYLIAFILISSGIVLGNISTKKKRNK